MEEKGGEMVEKWWGNAMEEGEMGEKKTKAQGHIPAPILGYIRRQPGQKALQAVYSL